MLYIYIFLEVHFFVVVFVAAFFVAFSMFSTLLHAQKKKKYFSFIIHIFRSFFPEKNKNLLSSTVFRSPTPTIFVDNSELILMLLLYHHHHHHHQKFCLAMFIYV
jgi:hypothetical protein